MYDYDWLGYGLLIKTPAGTCCLQGDEASLLLDELEACPDEECLELILSEYDHACEEE